MKPAHLFKIEALSAFSARFKAWLRLRSRAERVFLLIACLGLTAWAAVHFVFQPVDAWRDYQEREAHAWESRLNWLETQPRTQKPSELRPGLLTASLPQCGLELLRVSQEGAGVLVAIQDQSFECVLEWLILLEEAHAIEADQLRFQAVAREGGVTGTLRFHGN